MQPIYIETPNAPLPGGHYAQATRWRDLVFVSGQLPIRPDGTKEQGDIEAQTLQVLHNLKAILDEAGSSPGQVLKVTVYIADVALWGQVNAVYAAFFGAHRPARAIVPVPALHYGFLIEIDAIAGIG
ncbi:MAG TPA: RidA family protein [Saprospiraceae bacterium]|nr:RidA family protein [Saprospiraceae bacterium]HMP24029.1 RidA family protein [Saprospiraceae bacterium]